MKTMNVLRRTGALLGAGGALASALVLASAGSSAAATGSGTFTLCAAGNYTAYAVFTDRGDIATTLIPAGQCWSESTFRDHANDHYTVYGLYNTHPNDSFTVGSSSFNDNSGGNAQARGTAAAPVLIAW